jgi:hypothetical protein
VEYSSGEGDGMGEFLGALAGSKEPFASASPPRCDFGGCRTRPFLLDGRELGGGD